MRSADGFTYPGEAERIYLKAFRAAIDTIELGAWETDGAVMSTAAQIDDAGGGMVTVHHLTFHPCREGGDRRWSAPLALHERQAVDDFAP